MPYVVLDIDREDPLDSHNDTVKCLRALEMIGCNMQKIIVCYTGGEGFHIQIPSGMFGNPVFSSKGDASKILRNFVTEYIGLRLDTGVFNPTHLIRIIGSQHEDTGLYKRAYYGSDFLGLHPYEILSLARDYKSFDLEDPAFESPVSGMISAIIDVSERAEDFLIPEWDQTPELGDGISKSVSIALNGVSESDTWLPERGFVGRSLAMFMVASYLLKKHNGDRDKAWNELVVINERNDPPLPLYSSQDSLIGRFRSALNSHGRKQHRRCYIT